MKHFPFRWLIFTAITLIASFVTSASVTTTDFTYNPAEGLKLTRYTSSDSGDCQTLKPCIIFAFGGGFTHGQRNDERYLDYFRFMAEHGYVVCTIDYRTTLTGFNSGTGNAGLESFGLALADAIKAATTDYLTATAFILAHSGQWGLDPARFVASGSSAGAIAALQAEYTLITARPEALPASFNYAAAVTFAGAIFTQGEPKQLADFCPAMLFHGDADSNVPYDSLVLGPIGMYGSHYLATRFKADGSAGAFHTQSGADHSMALTPMVSNLFDIAGFLQRILYQSEKAYSWTTVTIPGTGTYRTDFSISDYIRANQ